MSGATLHSYHLKFCLPLFWILLGQEHYLTYSATSVTHIKTSGLRDLSPRRTPTNFSEQQKETNSLLCTYG